MRVFCLSGISYCVRTFVSSRHKNFWMLSTRKEVDCWISRSPRETSSCESNRLREISRRDPRTDDSYRTIVRSIVLICPAASISFCVTERDGGCWTFKYLCCNVGQMCAFARKTLPPGELQTLPLTLSSRNFVSRLNKVSIKTKIEFTLRLNNFGHCSKQLGDRHFTNSRIICCCLLSCRYLKYTLNAPLYILTINERTFLSYLNSTEFIHLMRSPNSFEQSA